MSIFRYGRTYVVKHEAIAVTASVDVLEIAPADDKPCLLVEAHLTQHTELKDAEEEQLRLAFRRGYTVSGSGGTSATIFKENPGDAAASFAAETFNTTVANTGTPDELGSEDFNNRIGWHFEPTPEGYKWVSQAQTSLVIRLLAAPADSTTFDFWAKILELG